MHKRYLALVRGWSLETGEIDRRHQIRRHFKQIAHPLVGDTTHGKGAHNRAVAKWLGVQRLWLHAQRLELGALVVEAAPPAEWQRLIPEGER